MKRCPECLRDYYDETLLFCLDDGARLLTGPGSSAGSLYDLQNSRESLTAILPSFERLPESPTAILPVATPAVPANTIAVLPFLNLSRNKTDEYFSDGLAEELLNVLAKIRRLRVAARTSAFSFKEQQTTVSDIGRILNVASVLEGSVRRAGKRVRITVQLVKVEDGYQLWSETYDRTMNDIFAVQDDIAQSVVEEIRVRLLGDERGRDVSEQVVSEVADAMKGRVADPEAQRLMLLGRHFLGLSTRADTEKAVEYFRKALDVDPKFALCWAELARAYAVQAGSDWRPIGEGFALAREAVDRALSLEPELAEGHALKGRILAAHERDLAAAERSYQRALELAPGSAQVLDGACILAYKMGRLDEARSLSQRVLEQDPLSSGFWHNLGLICHVAGRLDEAESAYRRALELAPQRFATSAMLSLVLLDGGKMEEALDKVESEPDDFWRLWGISIIYWRLGRSAEADASLNAVVENHASGNEFQVAEIYGARGDAEEAFRWLERAIAARDPGVTHARVDPHLGALHADPRWPDVLKRIGF